MLPAGRDRPSMLRQGYVSYSGVSVISFHALSLERNERTKHRCLMFMRLLTATFEKVLEESEREKKTWLDHLVCATYGQREKACLQ